MRCVCNDVVCLEEGMRSVQWIISVCVSCLAAVLQEKLSVKISAAQKQIKGEVESLRKTSVERCREVLTSKFENRWLSTQSVHQ